MKLAIIAASLLVGAQTMQSAAPPVNAIARSGALPMPQTQTTPRSYAVQPSTTPAPAAAAPGAPK